MNLYRIVLLALLSHIAYTGSRIAVALYALALGASAFTVGFALALYSALPMLFSVQAGRWIDRIGPRRPMLAATALVALGTLTPMTSASLAPLFVTALAVGSTFMLLHIASTQMVGVHAAGGAGKDGRNRDPSGHRARSFSIFTMGLSISGFLGPVIAGFAIDALGFPRTFLVLAIFPATGFALLAASGGAPRPREATHAAVARRLSDLLGTPRLRAVFASSALLSTGWDLFAFAVPLYGAGLGLPASTIGTIVGTFAVATFTVRVVLPRLLSRMSEWRILTAVFLVTAIAYLLFPLTRSVPLLYSLAFVLGLFLGTSQPMVLSLIFSHTPPERAAEAVGVRTTLVNASQTFMPLAFGATSAALGMLPVFWLMAAAMAGASWMTGRQIRR